MRSAGGFRLPGREQLQYRGDEPVHGDLAPSSSARTLVLIRPHPASLLRFCQPAHRSPNSSTLSRSTVLALAGDGDRTSR